MPPAAPPTAAATAPASPDGIAGALLVPTDEPSGRSAAPKVWAHWLATTAQRFLAAGPLLPEAVQAAHAAAARLVRGRLADARRAVTAALALPTVSAPIHALSVAEHHGPLTEVIRAKAAGSVGRLLLELALADVWAPDVRIEVPAAPLLSPTLRARLMPPPDAVRLAFGPGRIDALDHRGRSRAHADPASLRAGARPVGFGLERAFVPVGDHTLLALYDENPLIDLEAHPEKHGNRLDLGGRAPEDWADDLARAFELVQTFSPGVYGEMKLMLNHVVPVGWYPDVHMSCSYREAVGVIYMSLHPRLLTLAEALIHEFQHNKINAASFGEWFLENAFHPLYPSPVRPDPRPLWGVLLAIHAFLPVAEMYRSMMRARHPAAEGVDFHKRLGDIDEANGEGLATVGTNGRFTPAGRALFNEMERLRALQTALPPRPVEMSDGRRRRVSLADLG